MKRKLVLLFLFTLPLQAYEYDREELIIQNLPKIKDNRPSIRPTMRAEQSPVYTPTPSPTATVDYFRDQEYLRTIL